MTASYGDAVVSAGSASEKLKMTQRDTDALKEAWATRGNTVMSAQLPPFFKSGPMEYRTPSKEGVIFITNMLDLLSLGYTLQTVYGGVGIEGWVITFYDPATMQELTK